jgi:hypothetical protein
VRRRDVRRKADQLERPGSRDEVLAELRQIPAELWGPFNGDIDAIARYLRDEERKLPPERVSSRLPIRVNGFGAHYERPGS